MQPNPANNNQTPQKKDKKKYVIISLLILLAACVLATTISIPLIYSQKSKETTANVATDFDIVTEQFTQIENSYWNSHDKNEKALPALLQKEFAYANKMKSLGVFSDVSYEPDTLCVVCTLANGGDVIVYTPTIDGMKAGGKGSRIVTTQPFYNSDIKNDAYDTTAKKIAKKDSFRFNTGDNLDDEQVNLSTLKNLSGAKIILWDGHGCWTKQQHACLSLNITYKSLKKSKEFRKYCDGQRINASSSGRAMLTGDFFKDYYADGSFNGTFFYLATCLSGYDAYLSDILIQKGAAVVYSNYFITTVNYDGNMVTSVFDSLASGKTAIQALKKAQNENGKYGKKEKYEGICARNEVLCRGTKNKKLIEDRGKATTKDATSTTKSTATQSTAPIVQKLSGCSWSLYLPDSLGLVSTYKFSKNNQVQITSSADAPGDSEIEKAKYKVLDKNTVEFYNKHNCKFTVKNAYPDTDILLIRLDLNGSSTGILVKSDQMNPTKKPSSISRNLLNTQWNSPYLAKNMDIYQLVSFYEMSESSKTVQGGIMVNHGEEGFTTADVTDHCLYAYGETYDNFLAIQSSRNDRLYVILYPEDAKQPVLETWTKLS